MLRFLDNFINSVFRFDFDRISNLVPVDVSFGYGPSEENSFLTFSDSLASHLTMSYIYCVWQSI